MKISNIVSIPAFNVARAVVDGSSYKKGTSEELASSMLQHGWDETSFIGVRVPSDEELVIVQDYLQLELARLEELAGDEIAYTLVISYDENNKAVKTKVSNAMLLTEFREAYFAKGSKLKDSKKLRVTVYGHHRTHMVLVANAARANNGFKRFEPKALEHDYATEADWRDACIKENAQRERAATSITAIDVLRQAKELRDAGFTESKHRKELGGKKVGLIQKAWRFLKLDSAYPDQQFFGKAMLADGNKNQLPYKSLDKERIQTLLKTNEAGESASLESILAYVNKPLDKENKPLTMADLKTIRESAPNALLKALFLDITQGSRNSVNFLNSNSSLYNAVQKALPVDVPVLSHAESIAALQAAIVTLEAGQAELEG
ncbi:hypothetical protein KAU11_08025 [Candidatus Babeliales bacterium]|nr:hypothetical protein [Candidatus Babeliales bacterium]